MIKTRCIIFLLLMLIPAAGFSLEDTPANRATQVDRYIRAVPPKDLFQDIAEQFAVNLEESQRESFKATLTKNLDLDAVVKAMKDSMIKHFTADELAALADFYASPVAKSAMQKMGVYMADVMPTIQIEIGKAITRTGESLAVPETPPAGNRGEQPALPK